MHYQSTFLALALILLVGPALAQGPPSNDTCSTPDVISGLGTWPYDRSGATSSGFDGGDPSICGEAEDGAPGFDVFFAWTAPADDDYRIFACEDGTAIAVNIHVGSDCTATCQQYGRYDYECVGAETWLDGATNGTTYLIQVGNWNEDPPAAPPTGTLNIEPFPDPPLNDTCATPTSIAGNGVFPYTRWSATSTTFNGGVGSPCDVSWAPRHDVFFAWTATQDGVYKIDTCTESFSSGISVHDGFDCNATCIGTLDVSSGCIGPGGSVYWLAEVSAGDQFLIEAGTLFGSGAPYGSFFLQIQGNDIPTNDTCATPTQLTTVGSFPYDLRFASTSGFDGGSAACAMGLGGTTASNDVFFQWTAPEDNDFQFDICATPFFDVLVLHTGVGCSATCMEYLQAGVDCGGFSGPGRVLRNVQAGTPYLIQVGTWDNDPLYTAFQTAGTLNISRYAQPNQSCAQAIDIDVGTTPFTNAGTMSGGVPLVSNSGFSGGSCVDPVDADLFFRFTAPASGDFQFDTCGSTFDTRLAVHLGGDCAATCAAESDDACGLQSSVVLTGLAVGEQVLIQVGGAAGATGQGVINVSYVGAPLVNDDCSSPSMVFGEASILLNNTFATTSGFDGGDPTNCPSPANMVGTTPGQIHRDLFWHFVVPCDGAWRFRLIAFAPDDPRLAVHLGSDCSAVCIDDATGSAAISIVSDLVAGDDVLIQVGNSVPETALQERYLIIEPWTAPCSQAGIQVLCDPANVHYANRSARLNYSSLGGPSSSGLHLEAVDGPPGEFGFFLVSSTSTTGTPVSEGVLCLGPPTGRYNTNAAQNQGLPSLESIGQFDDNFVFQNLSGTSTSGSGFDVPVQLPFSPPGLWIGTGDTYYFQLWFRDQSGSPLMPGFANFSNVVEVEFP